jgi:hypothetical protein
LPSFSKDFLVGFECFQRVKGQDKDFLRVEGFSKFLQPPACRPAFGPKMRLLVLGETNMGQNETKSFRQRNRVFC